LAGLADGSYQVDIEHDEDDGGVDGNAVAGRALNGNEAHPSRGSDHDSVQPSTGMEDMDLSTLTDTPSQYTTALVAPSVALIDV
jgi:hypothetical protein